MKRDFDTAHPFMLEAGLGGIEARDLWVDAEPLCDAAQLQSARTLNLGRVGKRRGKPETRPSRSNPAGNPSNRPRRSAPCRFLLARNFPDSSPRVRFLWANAMSCLSEGVRMLAAYARAHQAYLRDDHGRALGIAEGALSMTRELGRLWRIGMQSWSI